MFFFSVRYRFREHTTVTKTVIFRTAIIWMLKICILEHLFRILFQTFIIYYLSQIIAVLNTLFLRNLWLTKYITNSILAEIKRHKHNFRKSNNSILKVKFLQGKNFHSSRKAKMLTARRKFLYQKLHSKHLRGK